MYFIHHWNDCGRQTIIIMVENMRNFVLDLIFTAFIPFHYISQLLQPIRMRINSSGQYTVWKHWTLSAEHWMYAVYNMHRIRQGQVYTHQTIIHWGTIYWNFELWINQPPFDFWVNRVPWTTWKKCYNKRYRAQATFHTRIDGE